jgi:prepilin-type N-terminal cleavage/methylation domain-containing protein
VRRKKNFDAIVVDTAGLSLVELLVVLALLGIVLAGIYNIFFFAQRSYIGTEAESDLLQQADLVVMRIRDDIRSAQKPNDDTNAVVVLGAGEGLSQGQQMDIYKFNDTNRKYQRIRYRLNPANKEQLQRGWVESEQPGESANPSYGNIENWETLLTGVRYQTGEGQDIEIFKDITAHPDSERRRIEINLVASAPNAKVFEINNSYMSRSHGTAAQGGIETPVVPVTGVTLNEINLELNEDDTFTLVATVHPSNATNRNVIWSSSNPGVATVQGDGVEGLVRAVGGGTAVITVTTEDGNKTAQCQVEVITPGCW